MSCLYENHFNSIKVQLEPVEGDLHLYGYAHFISIKVHLEPTVFIPARHMTINFNSIKVQL